MQGYIWQGGEGSLPLFCFYGAFSFNSHDEGIERMPVPLTDDTSLARAVSVAETRIIILSDCPKCKKLSEKDGTKWGNHHRNTRWGRASWELFRPIIIQGFQGTMLVKKSL